MSIASILTDRVSQPETVCVYSDDSPTKSQLKRLVNSNEWGTLGRMFNFKPVFSKTGEMGAIDWRCVPVELLDKLQKPQPPRVTGERVVRVVVGPARPKRGKRYKNSARRETLFIHQKGICGYCEKPVPLSAWTVDHRTPISRGGSNSRANQIGCCKTCNNAKSFLTEEEFRQCPPKDRKALLKTKLSLLTT